jgi:hypothetical protein
MALPGYVAQRVHEAYWAYSTKQQTDFNTVLANGDLTLTHPVRESNVAEVTKEIRSDRETFGKGHEFATNIWEVARDVRLTRNFDGSSTILGWLLAFALGNISTTNPSGSVYRHQMKFFDPDIAATLTLPVTTIMEGITANFKRILHSMAVGQVTLSAEGFEHINASAEFIGSGQTAVSTLAQPAMPSLSYLTSNFATINLGNAAEDISTRVRSWQVVINNNPREERGYYPSSGAYRGRLEIGSRSAVPNVVLDMNALGSDILDDFLAGTLCALTIDCQGATIVGSYKHYLKIIFPDLYYKAVPIEDSDGLFAFNVTADEDTVIYNSARAIPLIEVIVQNVIPSYLTTP